MERRFYVDTSVWIDYVEDRRDRIKPLGEFAFQFLKCCGRNECKILYSELIVDELKKRYSEEEVKQVFASFEKLLINVEISNMQRLESELLASRIREIHKSDVLHAILARDNNATLITRDKHFEHMREIAKVAKPEEIIFD